MMRNVMECNWEEFLGVVVFVGAYVPFREGKEYFLAELP